MSLKVLYHIIRHLTRAHYSCHLHLVTICSMFSVCCFLLFFFLKVSLYTPIFVFLHHRLSVAIWSSPFIRRHLFVSVSVSSCPRFCQFVIISFSLSFFCRVFQAHQLSACLCWINNSFSLSMVSMYPVAHCSPTFVDQSWYMSTFLLPLAIWSSLFSWVFIRCNVFRHGFKIPRYLEFSQLRWTFSFECNLHFWSYAPHLFQNSVSAILRQGTATLLVSFVQAMKICSFISIFLRTSCFYEMSKVSRNDVYVYLLVCLVILACNKTPQCTQRKRVP